MPGGSIRSGSTCLYLLRTRTCISPIKERPVRSGASNFTCLSFKNVIARVARSVVPKERSTIQIVVNVEIAEKGSTKCDYRSTSRGGAGIEIPDRYEDAILQQLESYAVCLQPIPREPYLACDSYALLKVPPASHHDVACASVPLVKHCVLEVDQHDRTGHDTTRRSIIPLVIDPSKSRPADIFFFFFFFDVDVHRSEREGEKSEVQKNLPKKIDEWLRSVRHLSSVSRLVLRRAVEPSGYSERLQHRYHRHHRHGPAGLA